MRTFMDDLRFAVRQLRKSPRFTIIVVLILTLGIGVNTAVFSVMNAVLIRPLPVSNPRGLFHVYDHFGGVSDMAISGGPDIPFTEGTFEALRGRRDVFEELIAYVPIDLPSVAVRHGDMPELAQGDEVSGNFFSGVGVRLLRGRGFTLDDEFNHASVAVISYDYWTRSFMRDPAVVGQILLLRGIPIRIIGITVRGFKGIENSVATDFWIPLQKRPDLNPRVPVEVATLYGSPKFALLRLMARLRPGVSPMRAQLAIAGTYGQVITQIFGRQDEKTWRPLLDFVPVRGIGDETYRKSLYILMGLVTLVLLIACTNIVMMVQARNASREHEFCLRLAFGAGKTNILRQLLAESLLLVIVGATFGWFFALLATHLLAIWSDIETGLSPDLSVLLSTLMVSSIVAMVFGLAPLRSAMNAQFVEVLHSSVRTMTARPRRVLGGRILMISQIAISLALLMAASLLLRTLRILAAQDLGMDGDRVIVFSVTPQGSTDAQIFYRNLLDRIRRTPGVESVSMVGNRPGSGYDSECQDCLLNLDGVEHKVALLQWNFVGSGFFRTMGIPILAGRDIGEQDTKGTPTVVVVNETLVRKYLSNTNPIGHHLKQDLPAEIVGVVKDSKYTAVADDPKPEFYYAIRQSSVSSGTMNIEVRARQDPYFLIARMREIVASLDRNVPIVRPMTQQEQFDESYNWQRIVAILAGFFGILASFLVASGLYGMHSFHVSRRKKEIGVRMAFGATRPQVLSMVLKESLWLLVVGLGCGVPLTFLAVRSLQSLLYRVSPFDVTSFIIAVAVITAVSSGAALIPARRAAAVEPMQALRIE